MQTIQRPALERWGLTQAGVPTRLAANSASIAGSLLITGGVALWLFS